MRQVSILFLALPVGLLAAGNPDFSIRSGARALGMGEASAAASQGLDSLGWNPASLANQNALEVSLGHTDWVGMSAENVALATGLGPGAIGITGFFDGTPDLIQRNDQGQAVGSLSYRNMGGTVAWAENVGALSLGLSAGGWQLDNLGVPQSGAQVNVGGQYRIGSLTLGAAGFQLESTPSLQGSALWGMQIGSQSIELGGGYISEAADTRWGIGGEVKVLSRLALRAGWEQATQAAILTGLNGLTAGLGLQLGALQFDYAWMPLGELGQVQRGQVSWRFETTPKAEPKVQVPDQAKEVKPVSVATPVLDSVPTTSEASKKEVKLKFVVPAE